MTDLHIRVDATEALGLMGRISDNFPAARTWALNRTAEEVNVQLQRDARSRMIFRGKQGRQVLNWYAPLSLPRFLRATDTKPYATPVLPENAGKILRPFEEGIPKTVERAGRIPVIPTKAIRPWKGASIPAQYFPTNLFPETRQGAKPARPLKSGKPRRSASWKSVRPFVLDPSTMKGLGPKAWGIYQRTGPKRGDIRMLWAYRPVVKRPDLLDTYATARRVSIERLAPNMVGAFRLLVRTQRGRASLMDLGV